MWYSPYHAFRCRSVLQVPSRACGSRARTTPAVTELPADSRTNSEGSNMVCDSNDLDQACVGNHRSSGLRIPEAFLLSHIICLQLAPDEVEAGYENRVVCIGT